MGVDVDLACARKHGGQSPNQGAFTPSSQSQTQRTPGGCEQNALSQQLADDAAPACSQGDTNSEFPRPRGRTGQKQVGDVDTGNQQNEANGRQQNEQERLHSADNLLPQRDHTRADAFVGVRIGAGEIGGNATHIGAGLVDTHSRLEAGKPVNS